MVDMDPSSSALHQWNHDVFISFRGADTRDGFTSHLHAAFCRKKISSFIDNELSRGVEITLSLWRTIEESKMALVIFSQNYASSPWCLDELEHIMKCRKAYKQVVLPVFYHVDPSDVEGQTGDFGIAFDKLINEQFKENMQKVERWRYALTEAAKLSGWDSSVIRPEAALIEDISGVVLKKLNRMPTISLASLVAIDSRIEEIESLLCMESPDVRLVGIWGMGGMGKTATAEAVFHGLCPRFDAGHFLANVKEELKMQTVADLRSKLLSNLLDETIHVGISHIQLPSIKDRLQRKRVLIVLDDVDDSIQLEELLGGRELFGQGSRILVTSRDRQVLRPMVDAIYEIERLNNDAALQLFSLHALKRSHPLTDLMELSMSFINYAKGNPLALKVLGSALFDKSKAEWGSALSKLGKSPNLKINNVLRVTYDGLDNEEKRLFLDIACFFRGKSRDFVTELIDDFSGSVHSDENYPSAHIVISVLVDKSLITISQNKLEMHDLLQEMGRNIVREESDKEPGSRSRLWDPYDVHSVLTGNKGIEAVEGISLDVDTMSDEMHLPSDGFGRMKNLRYLIFFGNSDKKKVLLPRGLVSLPSQLRYLHWDKFPLKTLPSNFSAPSLVRISLCHSKLERLWDGVQRLDKLKWIELKHSKHLRRIPDLSHAKNVSGIDLEGCKRLIELPLSIQHLNKLEYLILKDCKNLKRVPTKIDSEFLKILNLSNCSRVKILPEILTGNLEELDLCGTAIKRVPLSVYLQVESLSILCLGAVSNIFQFPQRSWCVKYLCLQATAIREVPSSIIFMRKLEYLDMTRCLNLSSLPDAICGLRYLQTLDLSHCSILESLPANICQLSQLRRIGLSYCRSLVSLPQLPSSLESIEANNCESLKTISSICTIDGLKKAEFSHCNKLDSNAANDIIASGDHTMALMKAKLPGDRDEITIIYPGSKFPRWFAHESQGSSISMRLPSNKLLSSPRLLGGSSCEYPKSLSSRYTTDNLKREELSRNKMCCHGAKSILTAANHEVLRKSKVPSNLDNLKGVAFFVMIETTLPPWLNRILFLTMGSSRFFIRCNYRIWAKDGECHEHSISLYNGTTDSCMRDHVLISYQPHLFNSLELGRLGIFSGAKAEFKFLVEDYQFYRVKNCGVHFL